jgi:hypothetical protein
MGKWADLGRRSGHRQRIYNGKGFSEEPTMNLPVTNVQVANLSCHLWVETQADGEVSAWVGEWPECRVTANSREQAIAALENRLQEQMEMRTIEVLPLQLPPAGSEPKPTEPSAVANLPKISKDDPAFIEFMAQLRAERELDEDNPAYTINW